jgi:hypothetical protein
MDKLRLETVKAERSKVRNKAPPPFTMINSELLHTTAVVQQIVWMRDSAETKRSYAINLVIANIAHYNIILDMA